MIRNLFFVGTLMLVSSIIASPVLTTPGFADPAAEPAQSCPDRLSSSTPSIVCVCGDASGSGSVWGSDVYTDDSNVCQAALHTGVIGNNGGVVEVREAAGRSSYSAETRNGVSSSSWGSYSRSITFRGARQTAQFDDCPDQLPNATASLVCQCPSSTTTSGSIWGSDTYTADSRICRAAVHAGVIGEEGGAVEVQEAAGRSSYPAATRHGVSSSSWGSFRRSIRFANRDSAPKTSR